MDFVPGSENIGSHFWIPEPCLMAEMDPRCHHISHRYTHIILRVVYISHLPKPRLVVPVDSLRNGYFFNLFALLIAKARRDLYHISHHIRS